MDRKLEWYEISNYKGDLHDITLSVKDGQLWLGNISLTRIATKITLHSNDGSCCGLLKLTIPVLLSGHEE